MSISMRQCLLSGFGIILLLFIITSVYVSYEAKTIHSIEERLLGTRIPTVLASEKLLDGIDLSLAGLRGYMILGKDPIKAEKFKAERASGWAKIDKMLAEYEQLSPLWTDPKNLERLEGIKQLVEEFRQAQQEVEDISHTPENILSTKILLNEAAPVASKVVESITAMINEEAQLEATDDRKALLKLMADSRGSFALGLASIRAYLLSGEDSFKEGFDKRWAINEERFKQISDNSYLLAGSQQNAWENYQKYRGEFSSLPAKMFALRSQEDWNKANYWLGTKAAPKAAKIKVLLAELAASQSELSKQDTELLYAEETRLEVVSATITIVSVIIGIGIAIYLSQTIAKQLSNMVNYAHKISEGDLTAAPLSYGKINDFNTLARALNQTNEHLNQLVSKIVYSSDGLSSHSEKLKRKIGDSEKISNEQREKTDLISTSMNEMGITVKEVALNTTNAAHSAEEADKSTSQGHKVVVETVDSINDLAKAIGSAADTINQLGEETNAVDTILVSISGIADQTNLLALNAAIEAARAGEQGRGFAVVADEVRTLAARTQESTVEIRSMLDRLKLSANEAVEAMSAGHKQAQGSVEKANIAKETLQSIASTVNTIKDMNTQIAAAAEEQSVVTDEMNNTINSVNSGAQEVVKHSNESIASAHEMAAMASQLAEAVAKFSVDQDAIDCEVELR